MGFIMKLQWHGDEAQTGESASQPAAEQSADAQGPQIQQGDTLADGTKVPSARVAAAMEKQMQRHPELRQVYGQARPQAQQEQQAPADANTLQAEWEQAKKGRFAQLYGQDVKNAIQERFKNSSDAQQALSRLEPALKVLRDRAGVEDNDSLVAQIMDDDSLYEEEANEAGMTIPAYKNYLKFKEEHDQHVREQEEQQRREGIRQHYMNLAQQAEQLKARFPDMNLDRELQNPTFLKLTSPAIGLSVEDAYFAVHHKELGPQMMAYGMQRARNQMAQTIMVQGSRPREGGMNGQNSQSAELKVNPRALSRQERDRIRNRIHAGEKGVTFD